MGIGIPRSCVSFLMRPNSIAAGISKGRKTIWRRSRERRRRFQGRWRLLYAPKYSSPSDTVVEQTCTPVRSSPRWRAIAAGTRFRRAMRWLVSRRYAGTTRRGALRKGACGIGYGAPTLPARSGISRGGS
jgi:hypothetical protein